MSTTSNEVASTVTPESTATLTKPPPPPRLPSLNQLAARMSVNSPAKENAAISPSSSSSRPRLAAFAALRTNSSTTVSSMDSMNVNAPTTRAGSPLSSSGEPASTSRSTPTEERAEGEGDALTAERLQSLENVTGEKKPYPKGYKNIPSLDAITARMTMAKSRTLSIDGSARPPEPAMVEDPKTPGFQVKPAEHPLEHTWTVYHDSKTPKFNSQPASSASDVPFPGTPASAAATTTSPFPAESKVEYEAGLTIVGTFSTVETFCRYLNWLKPPSKLDKNSNYHLFKTGIKPMWEDPANADGGKWVLTMKNSPLLLDRCWNWLAMALVGEELEEGYGDEICGAVVSLRRNLDRIQVWTRSKDNVERLNAIGKKIVALLDVSEKDGVNLEFQYNSEDKPTLNKFLSIQSVPTTGSYRSSFHPSPDGTPTPAAGSPMSSPGPGGAFGSFGVGPGWRGGKRGGAA